MKKIPSRTGQILRRHRAMVDDPLRTPVLEKAINKVVKPGDVVFDLGCGTGVLTLMALKAGAKKVYACEIDDSIHVARQKIGSAGFSKQAIFFHALSSEIKLPEKVDIILAETVGSLGFNENILPFVTDARRRFLKKGGVIVPGFLGVHAAPIFSPSSVGVTGRSPLRKNKSTNHNILQTQILFQTIKPEHLLSPGQHLFAADLSRTSKIGFDCERKFKTTRDGWLTGFAGWFEAEWAPGIMTRSSPSDPATHWKQAILPNMEETSVKKGDIITFRLILSPKDEVFSTETVIEWGYKIKSNTGGANSIPSGGRAS